MMDWRVWSKKYGGYFTEHGWELQVVPEYFDPEYK